MYTEKIFAYCYSVLQWWTEPNLPNTEALVRFGEIQEYQTKSFLLLISIFEEFGDLFKPLLKEINYFQNSKKISTRKAIEIK